MVVLRRMAPCLRAQFLCPAAVFGEPRDCLDHRRGAIGPLTEVLCGWGSLPTGPFRTVSYQAKRDVGATAWRTGNDQGQQPRPPS